MKYQYTLIILNWKRPENIIKIIANLHNHPYIRHIIVSNGHPNNQLFFNDLNHVNCYDDSSLNLIYGLDLRFLRGISAKTDKLIIMDDDIFIDHDNLNKLLHSYEINPNRIVGIEGRNMESDTHYYNLPYKSQYCDIVLTRLLVCDKCLCSLFFTCKPLVEEIYKSGVPYGNGEDILLSFIAKLYYNIDKHFLVNNIKVTELANQYSIHTHKSHIPYRKLLCFYLKNNVVKFKQILSNKITTTIQHRIIDNSYLNRNKISRKNVNFAFKF